MKDKKYYESLDKRTKEFKEYQKGLGDYVEDFTKATGIKEIVGDCEGCTKRKNALNLAGHKLEYFFKKHRPNKFTDTDKKQWCEFSSEEKKKLTVPQQKLIVRLLKDVLNMSVKPCSSCSHKVWGKYIKMINTVYNEQIK
jgi:hypothetical protein